MNKIFLLLMSMSLGSLIMTSCSDWTDDESVKIEIPENPDYQSYLGSLREYKNSDHKYIYAWFDNSVKTPSSRGQHMSDIPDSIDVVALMSPDNLIDFELEDMKSLQELKGTKVVYSIDFDQIQKSYNEMVNEELDKNEAYVAPEFIPYMQEKVNGLMTLSSSYNYDGIVVGYKGLSTVYMSDSERAIYIANQQAFISIIKTWIAGNPNKIVSYLGNPQFLEDKSLLLLCKHIILNTLNAKSVDGLSLAALQAIDVNVPTDRFIVIASSVSLDSTDKQTGYYASKRAITEASYWVTEGVKEYTKAGLAIYNIQNDYYNSSNTYKYSRDGINIITPAPKN